MDGVIICAPEKLGYYNIRPNQHKAVKAFLEGNDVFLSLPTGKSLCYAILHIAFDDLYGCEGSLPIAVSPQS